MPRATKQAGKRLYRVIEKINSGSLLKVLVIEKGEQVELTEKLAIKSAIHEENNKKFTQTTFTPTIVEPLVSKLRFLGNSIACDQLPIETDKYSQAYIKALARPSNLANKLKAEISTKGFQLG